jgi:Rps23 Pro-64 3,4-dihydroxylase Tpa1-like proline 4-hydroxylase
MTPKQILDSFSDTLMHDERILSARERALLAAVLQHAKTTTGDDPSTQAAVQSVIASAVGETVAQRAFGVLGASIVERILEGSAVNPLGSMAGTMTVVATDPQSPGRPVKAPFDPQSPGRPVEAPYDPQSPGRTTPAPGPQSPGHNAPHHHKEPQHPMKNPPSPGPQSPGVPLKTPGVPAPGTGPQSPGRSETTTAVSRSSAAVAERPETLPAQCVVLDEFLAPQELEQLTAFTLQHEADFRSSEVVSPSAEGGVVNHEWRRSTVLMDLAQHQDMIMDRIKTVLPQVLEKLGMKEFDIADVEVQVTASNDGDFFHFHSDNGSEPVASRHLTFVYFFHREPRQFEGGELRIHDARMQDGSYVSEGSYQTIAPQQNQIVFFPCEMLHEITPVKCPSQLFADSRFTLNGWLRQ